MTRARSCARVSSCSTRRPNLMSLIFRAAMPRKSVNWARTLQYICAKSVPRYSRIWLIPDCGNTDSPARHGTRARHLFSPDFMGAEPPGDCPILARLTLTASSIGPFSTGRRGESFAFSGLDIRPDKREATLAGDQPAVTSASRSKTVVLRPNRSNSTCRRSFDCSRSTMPEKPVSAPCLTRTDVPGP
jgi:hypothetical protein